MDKHLDYLWVALCFISFFVCIVLGLSYVTKQEQETIRVYIANGYQEVVIGKGASTHYMWQKLPIVGEVK